MSEPNLAELPGPAPHYITPAMAVSHIVNRGIAWPISGDHTTRARKRAPRVITDYIELARRKNV